MDEREPHDEALSRLMRAVHAEPDPVLWTRVRARLESGEERGLLGWLMRPAALATSVAALALTSLISVQVLNDLVPATTTGATELTSALIGVEKTPVDELINAGDAGDLSPADSGETP